MSAKEDKKFEKKNAEEILNLIEQYTKSVDKKEAARKLNQITNDLQSKNKHLLSQEMLDVVLAINSFTQAALEGNPYYDLTEFIQDLKKIINS